MKIGRQ